MKNDPPWTVTRFTSVNAQVGTQEKLLDFLGVLGFSSPYIEKIVSKILWPGLNLEIIINVHFSFDLWNFQNLTSKIYISCVYKSLNIFENLIVSSMKMLRFWGESCWGIHFTGFRYIKSIKWWLWSWFILRQDFLKCFVRMIISWYTRLSCYLRKLKYPKLDSEQLIQLKNLFPAWMRVFCPEVGLEG